jgi:protocatechuate 3,4-dioxygenase beta subunit
MTERGGSAARASGVVARVALSVLGAATLTLGGAFGAARPAAARTTAVVASGPGISSSAALAAPASLAAGSAPHIMLIVEENEGYTDILGSSSPATYLKSLANTYASATNWYAVQHNSPHDYLDLIVGSDLGLPKGRPYSNTTLVDELHSAGIPWKSYMESMPSNCFTSVTSNGLYDPNHNPFHYFKQYTGSSGWCSNGNLGSEGVVPYPGSSGLVSALDGSNAPDFVFLVPNDCDEMHGGVSACANSSNSQLIKAGDTWLSSNLAPVLNSTWFQQNGIVIITWDEGSDSSGCCGLSSPAGGHIATLVVASGNAGAGSFTSTGDHYGTLRAIADAYGVGLLGGSSNAVNGDLSGAFGHSTTGSIGGVVTDSVTSAAIAGASVSYTGSKGSGSTTTDSGGNYAFGGVAPGSYTVTASASGHTTQTASVTVTAGTLSSKNFALVPTVGSISGTVKDAQTTVGLVGASVTCACGGSATTGTGGAYSIANVAPGTYSMTFSATGYVSQTINNVVVTAGHATTESVALSSSPGAIQGNVTDATASVHPALAGVSVSCTCQGTPVTTNASGNYLFPTVAAGTYSLTFTDATFVTLTINSVTVTAGNTTTKNAALTEDGNLNGNVTDATTPGSITGATVTCSCQVGTVPTDGSGHYLFPNIAPGNYSLTFSDTGYVTLVVNNVGVVAGTLTTTNVALTEDGSITGNVTDATAVGNPILPGVTVTCSCQVGTATTDGSGNYFFLNVAPGTYSLTFALSGYVTSTINNAIVSAGSPTIEGTALTEDGGFFGTVTDSSSAPIQGVTVTCNGCLVSSATTNSSGNYTFGDIAPGTYSLTFSDTDYVTQTISGQVVDAGASTEVDAVMTTDGSVTGTVSDSVTHAAIPNASVTCTCQGAATTTNSSGVYTFTLITPASYTVTVTATGYTGQTSAPFTVNPGATTTQNFQLVSTAKPLGVVQSFGKAATTAGTTLAATTGTATALGDLLVVTVKDRSSTLTNVTGITDSSGTNVWAKATSIQSGGQADEEIWYVANAKSVTSVTVTVSGSASLAMTVVDISGATTTPFDKTMTATGTGTAASTGTTTTTAQASEIVIANIGWNSTVTTSGQTAGYTVLPLQQATVPSNASGEQAAWRILTTTGPQTYAATLSASVAWAGAIATFK